MWNFLHHLVRVHRKAAAFSFIENSCFGDGRVVFGGGGMYLEDWGTTLDERVDDVGRGGGRRWTSGWTTDGR